MDNTNHDSIVRMFYVVQMAEPLIEAKGNEAIKKTTKEVKAAIIAYLYSCKMAKESEQVSDQLVWSKESFKYLHILGEKVDALTEAIEDWNWDK